MGFTLNPPPIEFVATRRVRLKEHWQISEKLTIPEGFESDLGSVPRIFWWFIKPVDIKFASIIHDFEWFLADFGSFSYKEGNKIFFHNSIHLDKIPVYKAFICFIVLELVRIIYKKDDLHTSFRWRTFR